MTDPLPGPPGRPSGSARAGAGPGASVPPQYERPQAGQRQPQDEPSGQQPWWQRGQSGQGGGLVPGGDAVLATAARLSWPVVLLGALGLIAVGVALLVWPHASLTVVAVLIGIALIVSGLVRLVEGFTAHHTSGGMRAAYVVLGLLAVLAGLLCLRHHALSLFLVSFLIGVYFISHGISDIGVALSGRVPGRGVRGFLGVASLAAGLIMLVWPGISLVLLLTIAGAWLIFYGLTLGALAHRLRAYARAGGAR